MKRSRAKAVGLGLALLAGELRAADGDWRPEGGPTAAAAPSLLPREMQPDQWVPAGAGDPGTVWLPARRSVAPAGGPSVVPVAVTPNPNAVEPVAYPRPATVGPLVASAPLAGGMLPESPTVPAPAPIRPDPPDSPKDWRPVAPVSRPATEPVFAQPTAPQPRIVEEPRPKTLPDPKLLPPAQPSLPTGCELPTAPPGLMHPAVTGVPARHGSFGSPPIRIARDYPSLRDLCPDLFDGHLRERRAFGGRDRTDADGPGSSVADRFQFQAEYLLWWVRAAQIPPLATTTVAPGAVPSMAAGNGFLGDPATRLLLGPGSFGGTQRQGLRLRAGWWLDDCGTCGIDGSYFFLGAKTSSVVFNSPGAPVVTRPFFSPNINPVTGTVIGETGEIVAFPDFASGRLSTQTTSLLWGADVNLRHAWCRSCESQAWGFVGYRFLSLHESLRITELITALPGNPNDPAGTQVVVQDQFDTRNQFHGGQIGAAAERNWGRISLDVRASVALGDTHQTLTIDGSQLRLRPGMVTPDVFRGGLLAVGPNLGRFTQDKFSVVPEATANIGFWVTPAIKAYMGYNFLYWSNVIRPGDQIDRVVDVTFVPNAPPGVAPSGLNRPQPLFRQSDLWIHGLQFGVEWRW
ncbi:MAG TPA: BBP7 family outer membrane beta-barrel protein [Gemmataceae bacterium]|nr:BBP7 family outer membrane beta-barrel protein [Gemmataceae bacterium]